MKSLLLTILLLSTTSVFAKEALNPNNFICIHRENGQTECKNLKAKSDYTIKTNKIYKYKDKSGQVLLTNIKK